jgi:hypothetical protein
VSELISLQVMPDDGGQRFKQATSSVLLTLFWLACGFFRSSPGAHFCQLHFCHDDRSRISRLTALARSALYFGFVVLVQMPSWASVETAVIFALLFLIYLGLLLANFAILAFCGRPPLDRWLKVTVLTLQLPQQHIPKIFGIPIK